MLSISLCLIAALLLVAFNDKTRKVFGRLSKWLAVLWANARLLWFALKLARQFEKEDKKLNKDTREVFAEDFFEERSKPNEKPRKRWQGCKLETRGISDTEKASSGPVSPKSNGVVMS